MSPPNRLAPGTRPAPHGPNKPASQPFWLGVQGRPTRALPKAPAATTRSQAGMPNPPAMIKALKGALEARAPAAVLARVRVTQHQLVSTRVERREAGMVQDLERLLERTAALVRVDAVLSPPALSLPLLDVSGRPPPEGAVSTERRAVEAPAAPITPARIEAGSGAQTAPRTEAAIQERSAALVSLIDRIDRFVREGRPALCVSLGAVGWTVELERSGAGEVSLNVRGPGAGGFPPRGILSEALKARGLRLGALHRHG